VPVPGTEAAVPAAAISVVSGVMTRVSVVMTSRHVPVMGEIIGSAMSVAAAGFVHPGTPGRGEDVEARPRDLAGRPGGRVVADSGTGPGRRRQAEDHHVRRKRGRHPGPAEDSPAQDPPEILDLPEQLLPSLGPAVLVPAPQPAMPDGVPPEFRTDLVDDGEQARAGLRQAHLRLRAEQPVEQYRLEWQQWHARAGRVAAPVRQHPLRVSAVRSLFDAKKTMLAKVGERGADMADDNAADQDNTELSWP